MIEQPGNGCPICTASRDPWVHAEHDSHHVAWLTTASEQENAELARLVTERIALRYRDLGARQREERLESEVRALLGARRGTATVADGTPGPPANGTAHKPGTLVYRQGALVVESRHTSHRLTVADLLALAGRITQADEGIGCECSTCDPPF